LEFNVPFQHKYGYIREKKIRSERYFFSVKDVSDILTSHIEAFLFSSHPTRGNAQVAHLNYYASTCNSLTKDIQIKQIKSTKKN